MYAIGLIKMSSSMQKAARRYLKEDPSRYERWREALRAHAAIPVAAR